mmetsp:Transcript_28439/g.74731  ORF Transcript_28439/g.74731 Transcript_28439/m.74731 type:complete len:798 (+) Transcript_28439:213-2606(+)
MANRALATGPAAAGPAVVMSAPAVARPPPTILTATLVGRADLVDGFAWVHPTDLVTAGLGTVARAVIWREQGGAAGLGPQAVVTAMAAGVSKVPVPGVIVMTIELGAALGMLDGAAVSIHFAQAVAAPALHRLDDGGVTEVAPPAVLPAPRIPLLWLYPTEVDVEVRAPDALSGLLATPPGSALGHIAQGQLRRAVAGRPFATGPTVGTCTVLRHSVDFVIRPTEAAMALHSPQPGSLCQLKDGAALQFRLVIDRNDGGIAAAHPPPIPTRPLPTAPYFTEQHLELDTVLATLQKSGASASSQAVVLAGPIGSAKRDCAREFAISRRLPFAEVTGVAGPVSAVAVSDATHSLAVSADRSQQAMAILVVDASDLVTGPKSCSQQLKEVTAIVSARASPPEGGQRCKMLVVVLAHADDPTQINGTNHTLIVWLGTPTGEAERLAILEAFVAPVSTPMPPTGAASVRGTLQAVAAVTQGYTHRDLQRLCRKLWRVSMVGDYESRGTQWQPDRAPPLDWDRFIPDIRRYAPPRALSVHLAGEVPRRSWDDVAGYDEVKAQLHSLLSRRSVIKEPRGRALIRGQPSGVLLHGPSGCGKTLLASTAVANCGLSVLAVTAPTLMDKYVGETEHKIRELFRTARQCQPAVIFIDEVDALILKRGAAGGTTGVEERALSQLLNEMDGIEGSVGIFLLGCTSRHLDSLDAAALRPGRFEIHLEVGLPTDADRKAIAILHTTGVAPSDRDAVIDAVVAHTARGSSAEVVALCRLGALAALERCTVSAVGGGDGGVAPSVTLADFAKVV